MGKNRSKRLKAKIAARRQTMHRLLMILALVGIFGCMGLLAAVQGNEYLTERGGSFVSEVDPQKLIPEPLLSDDVFSVDLPKPPIVPDASIPPVSGGLAPAISKINTKQPVVFLTIDDGANKQPFELQLMVDNKLKASLFLAYSAISNNPSFFNDFVTAGSLVEDHTLHHKTLKGLSYTAQKEEICGAADLYQKLYGRRPVLFRPPGGSYDANTQRAAADCGMKAVVLWIAKANGGSMQYQVGHSLRPGDIVLMHFRPEFKQDLQAFIDAQNAAGLRTELLEDWL